MTNEQIIKEQKAWIASGKIGCVFASALVKIADKIKWRFTVIGSINDTFNRWDALITHGDVFILSMIFPGMTAQDVKQWALASGFYIESVDGLYEGLRIKMGDSIETEKVSWVQYFGPDSHVKTRQAPYPMLSFTCKLPSHVYAKTMAVGIMHLAHASIEFLTAKKCDTLWEQSYAKTKKELGHSPSAAEAAKVTFIK